ncbi:hypothetical protein J6590_057546 [Homalodisca vitripennis]|nr:hypothetical protein J6590_057546 [Homalodisca vitripennis]
MWLGYIMRSSGRSPKSEFHNLRAPYPAINPTSSCFIVAFARTIDSVHSSQFRGNSLQVPMTRGHLLLCNYETGVTLHPTSQLPNQLFCAVNCLPLTLPQCTRWPW